MAHTAPWSPVGLRAASTIVGTLVVNHFHIFQPVSQAFGSEQVIKNWRTSHHHIEEEIKLPPEASPRLLANDRDS